VNWKILDGKFSMDVEIPANTTAEVYIPKKDSKDYDIKNVGSGKYHFESTTEATVTNKELTASGK
jgi:alpha-L-rhamnosidase